MSLDTDTKKLSMMEFCATWEPGLPLSPGALGQDDQQHLIWGQSDVLWSALTATAGGTQFVDIWDFIDD